MSISAVPIVCILLSFVIMDSNYANTVAKSIFTSMFLNPHFNAKLTPFMTPPNSNTTPIAMLYQPDRLLLLLLL